MCLLSGVERFLLHGGFNVLTSMGEQLGPGIMSTIERCLLQGVSANRGSTIHGFYTKV